MDEDVSSIDSCPRRSRDKRLPKGELVVSAQDG
jgi:hypothetical protein